MATITLTFHADGTSEVAVKGHKGKGCHKLTEAYLTAIGGKVTDVTETSEACQGAAKAVLAAQEIGK